MYTIIAENFNILTSNVVRSEFVFYSPINFNTRKQFAKATKLETYTCDITYAYKTCHIKYNIWKTHPMHFIYQMTSTF
jgi:hypothetical protein